MSEKKVSVIIPVYNTAAYLPACLDSVLKQTLRDIEVVVVIDASPDHSIDVVRDYQRQDDRIKIVDKEINGGLAAARNSGVAVASGEYLVHLDSDDFWIDDRMLRELYDAARVDGCDILRFNGYEYKGQELTTCILDGVDLMNGNFDEDDVLWCYRSVFLYFFKKEFVERCHLSFVPGICLGEDGIFLSAAFVAAESISSTSACYYAYRVDSGMMKKRWTIDQFLEEEMSSGIIINNISKNQYALHNYLSYRISVYWPKVVSGKAMRELSKGERFRLYEAACANFSKLDVRLPSRLKLYYLWGKLLYRCFVSADFQKLDWIVGIMRFLVPLLPIVRWLSVRGIWVIRLSKRIAKRLGSALAPVLCVFVRKEKVFKNLELLDEYNFTLPARRRSPGVSAMLRVKNEERRIRACIESIVDVFDEIVVVDNGSDDSTLEIIHSLMGREKYAEKVKLFSYPHRVARCGPEHASTLGHSVNSLSYYYNWCLSKCRFRMVCKWDADMLLSPDPQLRVAFESYLIRFGKRSAFFLGSFAVQTVYVDDEGQVYKAAGEVNEEVRLFPNSSLVCFSKGELWEVLDPAFPLPVRYLMEPCVYEIKDVADDEFSNWSSLKFKNTRKVTEYRNYMRVKGNWHKDNSEAFVPVDFRAHGEMSR